MCIVSFIAFNEESYILTHNRDEAFNRPFSATLQNKFILNQSIQCPIDEVSGGTWIYASAQYTVCVLNGAFLPHQRKPNYAKSRGIVILELLNYQSIDQFIDKVNLENVEPFTMLMIDNINHDKKTLIWDEVKKHIELFGQHIYVKSSSTLYNEQDKIDHNLFLTKTLKSTTNATEIIKLHQQIALPLNHKRLFVKTTSITQICYTQGKINMTYKIV